MPKIFIVGNESELTRRLREDLTQRGLDCLIVSHSDRLVESMAGQQPCVMLLDADETESSSETWELAQRTRQETNVPIIALMSRQKINGSDLTRLTDDFVVKPCETAEVTLRIRRILRQDRSVESQGIIRCGDLVIDLAKCEVSLCGKVIVLTFKEYQLLRFLANNKGRVFTRNVLLDKVWGWDYYGGDRTVDVHIRRLRSKIEDSTHTFIETVRNIGYRFKDL